MGGSALCRSLCVLTAALSVAVAAGQSRDCCPPPLAPTERGAIEPDLRPLEPAKPWAAQQWQYRLLELRDAQCRAVKHAPLADTLARERHELASARTWCDRPCLRLLFPCHCDDRANRLRIAILEAMEHEIRNRSAGIALEIFFRIAEAEAKDDLLRLGRSALKTGYEQARDVADRGFKLPIELPGLERQRLEVEADLARLHGALGEWNSRLKSLIGQDCVAANERLWPSADWTVSANPIAEDDAIRVALQHRAELQLLRRLDCDLDVKTLPVIREFLKGVHATLGAQGGSNSPFVRAIESTLALVSRHSVERALRSGQLQQLLSDRERAVADEVRQALAAIAMNAQLVELDRRRLVSMEARVQEMRDRAARGAASFLDVMQTDLELFKIRAVLIGDIMAWHRACAQLRTAQGLLVCECAAGP